MAHNDYKSNKKNKKIQNKNNIVNYEKVKPHPSDFYDEQDPRGPSTREMDEYHRALDLYNAQKKISSKDDGLFD